jgi:electron transfer flavoprotein beta subunit
MAIQNLIPMELIRNQSKWRIWLTRAIWFQEQQGATVTVVNVGPDRTYTKESISNRRKRAIRVNANYWWFFSKTTSRSNKKMVHTILIIAGKALDYNGGMVPEW